MQAIRVKYIPPTNFRGSRFKAQCERGSVTVPFDYALPTSQRHKAAADALVRKFMKEDLASIGEPECENSWGAPKVSGTTPDGNDVFVFLDYETMEVVRAAREVVKTWASGDLPKAVQTLADALRDFDAAQSTAE